MTSQVPESVPYIVHESAQARAERTIKRLIAVIVLLIVLLVGSNVIWIVYENQFEDIITVTQESEANDGGSAIVNNGGDFNYYGESKTNSD